MTSDWVQTAVPIPMTPVRGLHSHWLLYAALLPAPPVSLWTPDSGTVLWECLSFRRVGRRGSQRWSRWPRSVLLEWRKRLVTSLPPGAVPPPINSPTDWGIFQRPINLTTGAFMWQRTGTPGETHLVTVRTCKLHADSAQGQDHTQISGTMRQWLHRAILNDKCILWCSWGLSMLL